MKFLKDKTSLRFLYSVSGKTKLNIFFLTLIQAFLGIFSVSYAIALKNIINAAVDGKRNVFVFSVIFLISLFLLQEIFKCINRWLNELTKSILENKFKSRLFGCILGKDFSSVAAVHSGEWMNRLTSDTVVTANGLTTIIPGVFGMSVRLIGAIVLIVILEPRFCFIIIPGGILLVLFSYVFRKKLKLLHKKIQEKDGKLRIFIQDILGSILIIRSFAIEKQAIDKADEKMHEHKKARMKRNHFHNFCNVGFGVAMNGAYIIGAAFCGYGILTGTMSYGTFTAVLQLVGQVQTPFADISGYLPQFYSMLASAERLMDAENLPSGNDSEAMPIDDLLKRYKTDFMGLQFKNVSFTYQPPVRSFEKQSETVMPVVLENISLSINKGEYVAFTGQSGCGKSTVMKLMLSLYKVDSGEKIVVTSNGEEPLDSKWQKLFAYVPQGNHLMSGTIREIISLSDESKKNDDEAIKKALKIACAEDFVGELKDGIDTLLGERGQGLSEGQMQRIAVARAIFSEAPILLLDESTSALDMQTEKNLLNNLKEMTDKTVVIVTHRPAALEICDKILEFTANGCEVKSNE